MTDIPSKQKTPLKLESSGGKSLLFTLDDDGELVVGINDERDDSYTDFILSVPDLQKLREWLAPDETSADCHGLDTARQVFFYEQDFYVLSNFSAFEVHYHGFDFKTSEHAYHWTKFYGTSAIYAVSIREAPSAHEAFKMAERWRDRRRTDWDSVKVTIMRDILRAKAEQHEYVARKLEATGDRELIENSWRDDFWGWGPNRDGQNMLGKLWMEIRAERRAVKTSADPELSEEQALDLKTTTGKMRQRAKRFGLADGVTKGRFYIDDDDFHWDAALRVSGDFESDAEKRRYAQAIADVLSAHEDEIPYRPVEKTSLEE